MSSGLDRHARPSRRSAHPGKPSPTPAADLSDPALSAARTALEIIFGPVADRKFAIRYWNGITDSPDDATPGFTLTLRDEGSLRRMLWPPSEIRIAESFIRGDYDIEGNLEAAASLTDGIRANVGSPGAIARLARALLRLPAGDPVADAAEAARTDESRRRRARHTPDRDAIAVRSHYDLGNDFYKLWLDPAMVYSCAYFKSASNSLERAQADKLDHICRKLRLQPGDSLLDVGCGWGALVMHAVERYGVTALGVTLSEEQATLARQRVRDRGLADHCTIELRDYRHIPLNESFDKIASVGMVEHVGVAELPTYFTRMYGLLRDGGLMLNHGISHAPERGRKSIVNRVGGMLWGEDKFIDRYVFPDGELPTLAQIITSAENAGFETRDVESLREHYALTLRHWVQRLEEASDQARTIAGEPNYRVWRLYMSGAAHGFATGRLGLDQTLLSKAPNGRASVPLTREDLY